MLIAYVVFPKDANLEEEEINLIKFAREMQEDIIESIYNDVFYDTVDDFNKGREKIIETIKSGFKALQSRRSTWITVEGNKIFLSGGLSWGDTPSEEYEEINALSYIMDER